MMLDHVAILRHHAGLLFNDPKPIDSISLDEIILSLNRQPDEIRLQDNVSRLEVALREFLSSAFALDQRALERICLYAFSRIGAELSFAAYRCEAIESGAEWIRLRLILDICLDAIIAGDMQPYEEMVRHELSAKGVDFVFQN